MATRKAPFEQFVESEDPEYAKRKPRKKMATTIAREEAYAAAVERGACKLVAEFVAKPDKAAFVFDVMTFYTGCIGNTERPTKRESFFFCVEVGKLFTHNFKFRHSHQVGEVILTFLDPQWTCMATANDRLYEARLE